MTRLDRRALLRRLGAGALGVGALGVSGALSACGAPATPPAPAPAPSSSPTPTLPPSGPHPVYLGTYTDGDDAGKGIGYGLWDPSAGRITVTGTVPVDNPSFLAVDPTRSNLYAVNEQEDGQVSAFALEHGTPRLINSQSSGGQGPTHLCVHPSRRFVLSANYDSGSVVVHPVRADGGLDPASDLVTHTGSGPNKERQEGPHAHQVIPDRTGQLMHAVDLGTDTVYAYRLDLNTGKLTEVRRTQVRPGSGPRHMVFHPNGRFAYLVTELTGTVITFGYSGGMLSQIDERPSLPGATDNAPAEVAIPDDGRHLYVSNRGPDSISVFTLAPDGKPVPAGSVPCGGKGPRFIGVSTGGGHLFSANQDSGTITVFTLAPDTGALTPVPAEPLRTPQPSCVLTTT
jgi:6-phosphogluconolactonase